MRKGLSLVELLIAFCILAIVVAITYVSFENIRQNTQSIAQDRDQASVVQLLDIFKATGGNLKSITTSTTLTANEKAQALTKILKDAAASTDRITQGAVGDLMGSNSVVVPYTANDGATRLIVDSTTGDLKIATSGSGFAIVPTSSSLATSAVVTATSNATAAATQAQTRSTTGAKYTNNQNFVWNEDNTPVTGPTSGSGAPVVAATPPVTNTPVSSLVITNNAFGFNYNQYISSGLVEAFVYRQDLQPLSASDLSVTGTFAGVSVPATCTIVNKSVSNGMLVTSGGTTVCGAYISFYPKDVLPANGWTQAAYNFQVTAVPSAAGKTRGIDGTTASGTITVTAIQTNLNPPVISLATPLNTGGLVTINAATNNSTYPAVVDVASMNITGTEYAPANNGVLRFTDASGNAIAAASTTQVYLTRYKDAP